MPTLLIADNEAGRLSPQTARALRAALALEGPVDVLAHGRDAAGVAEQAAALDGVRRVRLVEAPVLADGLAEPLADLVVSLAGDYSAIVAAATSAGKNLLPRVAALLDVMQVSEVTAVLGAKTFRRQIYAGNAMVTVESTDPVQVLTVRTASFAAIEAGGAAAPIEPVAWSGENGLSRLVSASAPQGDRPDLAVARVVVSGGRAFGSKESFEALLQPLAAKLGAAIGASRAAVDAGYAPNDVQVGQTGRVVAPELYIACGISGAIQHLAGIKDARVIVAINKDADAPIFQVADYGLVGDVFELLPRLEKAL